MFLQVDTSLNWVIWTEETSAHFKLSSIQIFSSRIEESNFFNLIEDIFVIQ